MGMRTVVLTTCLAGPVFGEVFDERITWYSQSYSVENGLSGGLISAITQDADGFLWVGTDAGLVRFDGLTFEMWGTHGEPPLPDNNVRSLITAHDGTLWVGFRNGTITQIGHEGLRNFAAAEGLRGGRLTALVESDDGTIWAGTSAGISKFLKDHWVAVGTNLGVPENTTIYNLRQDRAGNLWVASATGLFRKMRRDESFQLIAHGSIRDVSQDKDGVIWITSPTRGFFKLDTMNSPASESATGIPASGTKLLHDSRGGMWIGTLALGLWRSQDLTTVERVAEKEIVNGELTTSIFEDREGDIWVGSRGLTRFFQPDVTMLTRRDGFGNNIVRAVATAPDGSVWGTVFEGLNRFSAEKNLLRHPQRYAVHGTRLFALSFDAAGRLLIGADDTVGTLVDGSYSPLPIAGDVRLGSVTVITADSDGGLWLCHSGGTWISRWHNGTLTAFDERPETRGKECTAAYKDREGRLWLGFADGTLAWLRKDEFTAYSTANGLPNARILAMHEDAQGVLWIATSRGLSRLRDQRIETLDERKGLPGDSLIGIVEDENGDLWLAIPSGIIRLSKSDFEKAVKDSTYRVRYRWFDSSDGLLGSPARIATPTSTRGGDGTLWFTTAQGIAVVDPNRLIRRKPTLVAKISGVLVDQMAFVPSEQNRVLPLRSSLVQIDYTAVSLSEASKIRFRYMLEGFDKDWINAGRRRQAFYTNLPPRHYRFLVRGSINGADEAAAEWAFEVLPRFYQTGLFYTLCVAAAAAVLVAGWWLRLRILRRQFSLVLSERARIGREIHDTVLQSLAAVALQLEGIGKRIEVSPVGARSDLRHVRRQVEQYIYEARQSILELRSPVSRKQPLCSALRESASTLLERTHAQFELTVLGTSRPYPRETELQLLRIAQEAIRNALRHGEAGHIHVELHYGLRALRILISDDGRGFESSQLTELGGQHWGLVGMRERAKRLGGTFSVRSSLGKGTQVEAVIPSSH